METRIIGVDLGGTRMRVALLDADYNLLNRVEDLTNAEDGPDVVIARFLDLIASVVDATDEPITAIGISSPGPIHPDTGVIVSPPNLPGWDEVPLGKIVQDRFPEIPTFIGNDANVAALAEVAIGAAKGHKHAIYITVSTGIGGGIVVDGDLLVGGNGLGGELGHTVLIVGDRVSTLEEEAAGPAIAEYVVAQIEKGIKSSVHEAVGGNMSLVSGKVVGQAALEGDALAVEAIERSGRLVGYAIASMMHLFNPTIFVVGGGVSNVGDLLFVPMREAAQQSVIDSEYFDKCEIVPAALGEDVAIIGAAALAVQVLNKRKSYCD